MLIGFERPVWPVKVGAEGGEGEATGSEDKNMAEDDDEDYEEECEEEEDAEEDQAVDPEDLAQVQAMPLYLSCIKGSLPA